MLAFVFGTIVVGVALVAFWLYRVSRQLDALVAIRAVKISGFPEGERAKVVGTLEYSGEPLVSPLTGRPCAYYNITVEENVAGSWYEIIREEKRIHFSITDATGAALVDTGVAEVAADVCVELQSGTLDNPTPQEESYLATHGKRGEGWFFNKSLRYREGVLEAGEMVSVFGHGSIEPDPDGEPALYREAPAQRLRMSGTYDEPLLISDNASTLR